MVDTAPPPPKPVREQGYAGPSPFEFWQDLTQEETPELRWPFAVWVYDRMRRQDAQVASVLRAVTTPIIQTGWRVDGRGCSDEVTEFVAENLGLPIVGAEDDDNHKAPLRGRDRFSFDEHLRLSLLMLPFGHSFFEQVYRYDESTNRFRLRKLGPRLPKSIARVNVARDGGLVSVQQWDTTGVTFQAGVGMTGGGGRPIPVTRLVAYVLDREGGNWLGQSILRSAYKNWLLKDRALRSWSTSIDRNGVGIPIYTGADGEADLAPGQEMAEGMRGGDNAGGAIPFGSKMNLLGVSGTLPDIDEFVRYQDEQIARSALGHVLNLGSQGGGQVGSYNLGAVFRSAFDLGVDSVAGLVADTGSAHVIEDLVDVNFGRDVPAPQLVHDQVGTDQNELDRVREAAGLTSDADLVKFLRTIPATKEAA